ncbi:claudin-12 [Oncorhynchus mykiss]|uniref:Claudin 12 n=1 Tax=Oncorhynchus mykiss TaxID=8022 RepID=A0A8C7LR12_ONCMY|nr:claudin-12 [Oncorhynchus mykiss]XP_021476916.2 claudin-12 [Oncorhynchus mykiss]
MSCRDIHATNAFSFIIAFISVGGIAVAALIPQWRVTRLVNFNKNAKNISVYDGLWAKCVKQDGYSGCYYYDSEWYSKVDQLDLRLLQFCLPTGLLFGSLALVLCMAGMSKTCCCSDKAETDIKSTRCLVNSAGCHLVAGMFLFLGGAIALAPSVWFLFRTKEMNIKYDRIFSDGFAVYVAIGCSGGLMLAALLMFMWYCMCKKLPSPFWLPLPTLPNSLSTQPLTANGYPPSPVYGPPQTFPPQGYVPTVMDAQPYAPSQGYPQSVAPLAQQPQQVYMSQMSAPDGYGSEVGQNQAYSYALSQSYAPSQVGYAPSYVGHHYSTRSRMSGIEIDIPVLTQDL